VIQSSVVDSNHITIKLIQPECSDVVHGVIRAFNVYYCQYDGDQHCNGKSLGHSTFIVASMVARRTSMQQKVIRAFNVYCCQYCGNHQCYGLSFEHSMYIIANLVVILSATVCGVHQIVQMCN